MSDTYSHGHHESVVRSHVWRTAENSAAYLLPRLRPALDLLDVGCGAGTITRELAALVHPGRVIGVDASDDVIVDLRAADPRIPRRIGAAGRGCEPSLRRRVELGVQRSHLDPYGHQPLHSRVRT